MFYSHTFLARKGPLGTVWCAAHLQHRLKKSHYTSTDIGSTVERIMFPEVPIALRMSGHLLLGVVRIYSKKVDYLYQDYNFFLISIRKAFATVEVNLPEDATHAPIHSVTLPDTFELDALDLDDDFYNMGNQDKNLKSLEDITLSCDQIPTGKDPYITISFDENLLSSLHSDDTSGLGARPMEEDAPPVAASPTTGTRDPSPGYQAGVGERPIEDSLPEDNPEIEVWRDAVHVDNIPLFPDPGNDVMEPDKDLELQIMNEKASVTTVAGNDVIEPDRDLDQQTMNDKELLTPVREEIFYSGERSIPPPVSDCALDVLGSNISSGHASPNLAIRSTPPIDKPKARTRKRKHLYDESTVLTNKFMKAALNNCTDIRRKRKCCPSSDLDVWKSNNRLRKEKIFDAPLITGMSTNLCNIYKQDFISSKPHLVMEEFFPEPSVAQSPPMHEARFVPSPQVHDPMSDIHTEIERQRNYEGPVGSSIMREIMGSPSQFTSDSRFTSPSMRDDFTPALASSLGSESQLQMGTTIGTASTGTLGSEMETPMTFLKEPLGLENTGLSDIPEVMDSAEADDLNFLASEDYTPSKFQRTEGFSSLSGTTRKVAQYLKGKYSVSPISEDLSGDLSFNKLLEGKTRKVCARMFFETLVLKCCELVDVEQEEPYGDINLKLTPLFFKDQV